MRHSGIGLLLVLTFLVGIVLAVNSQELFDTSRMFVLFNETKTTIQAQVTTGSLVLDREVVVVSSAISKQEVALLVLTIMYLPIALVTINIIITKRRKDLLDASYS